MVSSALSSADFTSKYFLNLGVSIHSCLHFISIHSFPSLPYLALSLGGEMANKIVPSGQCGLQEFARTKHFPFALSWRACAQEGWASFPSGLHLVISQKEPAST